MGCMGSSEQSMGTTSYRAIAILAACTKATDGAAAAKGSQEVLRSSSVMHASPMPLHEMRME